MRRPIFLIGFMCSGKTTFGAALARAISMPFIDLDRYIVEREGMSVKEIFAERGEEAFRELEREALEEIANGEPCVVACGGGTPCNPGAMELMNGAGLTVYLQPEMGQMVSRLMHGRHKRPLIAHIETAEEMEAFARRKIAEREPFYSKAQMRFDSTHLENQQEIDDTINKFKVQSTKYEV